LGALQRAFTLSPEGGLRPLPENYIKLACVKNGVKNESIRA